MSGGSPRLLDWVRSGGAIRSTATHRNLVTGAVTDLPIVDGTVTIDRAGATRRALDLTLPPLQSLFDALDTPGGEITVKQSAGYIGARETFQLGVFIVDQDQIGYAPGDSLTLAAPDRWLKVQRCRFGNDRASVPTNPVPEEIKRLFEGAWPGSTYPPPDWAQFDTSVTATVGSVLWDDGERAAAILKLASDNGLQIFLDAYGQAVLQKIPDLTPSSTPVWTADTGANGVLIAADRTRDMSRVRNSIRVTTAASDVVFDPVIVENTTVGDPYNVTGPLGRVTYDYQSPTLRSSGQALVAGKAQLKLQLGVAKQLTLTALSNPALDVDQVIEARLPRTDLGLDRPVELHIVDRVTHPLTPQGTQEISTRSTRPDSDGS